MEKKIKITSKLKRAYLNFHSHQILIGKSFGLIHYQIFFHWCEGHLTAVAPGGANCLSMLLSVFNVPSSLFHKNTPIKSQNVQDHKLDIESRAGKKKRVS